MKRMFVAGLILAVLVSTSGEAAPRNREIAYPLPQKMDGMDGMDLVPGAVPFRYRHWALLTAYCSLSVPSPPRRAS